MKRADLSIKKRIKRQIELKHVKPKMNSRQALRTKGKRPEPIDVKLTTNRNDIRRGVGVNSESKSILSVSEVKEPVSIIVTAYQTHEFIEECLDSIETQTYFFDNNDFEILIGVDACQETLDKILSIRHKYRNLRIFMMKKNVGTYITTNTLLKLSTRENIIRFDSDDVMRPHMINEIMYYADEFNVIRIKCEDFRLENNNVNFTGFKRFAAGVIFYKKNLFEKLGGYKPWKCAADSELIQRFERITDIKKINKILFNRRTHPNSLSNRPETTINSDIRKKYHEIILKDKKEKGRLFVQPRRTSYTRY